MVISHMEMAFSAHATHMVCLLGKSVSREKVGTEEEKLHREAREGPGHAGQG